MERSIDDLTFSFSSVASAVAFSIVGDWNKSFTSDWKLSISSTIFSFMISNTQLKICMPNSFCSEIWGLLHLTEWKQYNDRWVLEVYCNIVFFFLVLLYFSISQNTHIHDHKYRPESGNSRSLWCNTFLMTASQMALSDDNETTSLYKQVIIRVTFQREN